MAPLWDRVWARVIDAVLIVAAGIPLLVAMSLLDVRTWWPLAASLLWWGYDLVSIACWGQTFGKRRAGVQVVDGRTGERPTWWQSFLRAAPMLLGRIPYVGWLALVLYLPMVWDPLRRGWHDRIARTLVVPPEGTTPRASP